MDSMHLAPPLLTLVVGLALHGQVSTYQQVPPRDATEPAKGTASLSGRVVAGDTGAPQREATVILSSRELSETRRTLTDAEGRYAFTELPAGRFALTVSPSPYRPGYLPTRNGLDDWRVRIVELADDQAIEHVDVALDRAGAMTGRVVDEFGDPMANIRVNALASGSGGAPRNLGSGLTMTDDHGRFRVFGLAPGDYYLKTDKPNQPPAPGTETHEEGYLPTYYPGTANAAEAPVLTLERGQELTELEIRLVRSRTFRITGLVFGLDGRPAGGARIMVTERREGGGMSGYSHSARPDGTFEIPNLAPGEYVLGAMTSTGMGRSDEEASAPVQVVIAGADVDNLSLSLTLGVTLRGQIVTDAGAVPVFQPTNLRVNAMTDLPSMLAARSQGAVNEDWTFEVPGVRAPVVLRTLGRIETGYRVMGVYYRGIEITEDFTEFREPTTPRELQVVISNRGATLNGTLTDAAGRPKPLGTVVLFPAEPEHRTTSSLRFRMARADESGHYSFDVLPPGDYLVAATDGSFRFNPLGDRQAFDALVPHASHVILQGEEQKTMDLRVPERK